MKTLMLPDLGEGLTEAEIQEWHVVPGDQVQIDQVLVTVETAKATVDIPSPYEGRISQCWGKSGDIIKTGSPLVAFESESSESTTVVGQLPVSQKIVQEPPAHKKNSSAQVDPVIKALPAARALAKQNKILLETIQSQGANGVITVRDVRQAIAAKTRDSKTLANAKPAKTTTQPLKGARRAMATALTQAHQNTVPVTLTECVDLYKWPSHEDVTLRLIQAIVIGCQTEPALNAHFHPDNLSRTLYTAIHLGIALDTKAGLYVPVLHDVATQKPDTLRQQLTQFKSLADNHAFPPDLLKGATITLSNFGSIAGLYATPMVVPPTVAILGVGRLHQAVVANNGQPAVHPVLPLSLTIDHRAVTGGEAARFLKAVSTALSTSQP